MPDPREPVALVDRHDEILGWGLPSEQSAIAVRMLGWGADPPPEDWLARRLTEAISARRAQAWSARDTTGFRVVNSEGDGLPGLVIDRYDDQLVMQLTTAPMAALQPELLEILRADAAGPIHIIRPAGPAKFEGFEPGIERDGVPDPPDSALTFREHGLRFSVPPPPSQKTGAYFDQRANRQRVAQLARHTDAPLLDLGCHVGGFALHAAAAGVPAVGVDQSASMLKHAAAHARLNELTGLTWIEDDMFGPLDDPRLRGPFGTIVVDPPKIAARKRDVDRASAAMQRMVARVAPRVAAGGWLVLCSCSHHLGLDRLDRMTQACAGRWSRAAVWGADIDHPIAAAHAEGEYLRVAVYQRRA